jgi:hypothetical protein
VQRNEWKFDYTASRLAEAASDKIAYHRERLGFWRTTREGVMATIRAEGLEIDEKIVLSFRAPKGRDWERGAEVIIRNDLQKDLASASKSSNGIQTSSRNMLVGSKC